MMHDYSNYLILEYESNLGDNYYDMAMMLHKVKGDSDSLTHSPKFIAPLSKMYIIFGLLSVICTLFRCGFNVL